MLSKGVMFYFYGSGLQWALVFPSWTCSFKFFISPRPCLFFEIESEKKCQLFEAETCATWSGLMQHSWETGQVRMLYRPQHLDLTGHCYGLRTSITVCKQNFHDSKPPPAAWAMAYTVPAAWAVTYTVPAAWGATYTVPAAWPMAYTVPTAWGMIYTVPAVLSSVLSSIDICHLAPWLVTGNVKGLLHDGHGMASVLELGCAEETGAVEVKKTLIHSFNAVSAAWAAALHLLVQVPICSQQVQRPNVIMLEVAGARSVLGLTKEPWFDGLWLTCIPPGGATVSTITLSSFGIIQLPLLCILPCLVWRFKYHLGHGKKKNHSTTFGKWVTRV